MATGEPHEPSPFTLAASEAQNARLPPNVVGPGALERHFGAAAFGASLMLDPVHGGCDVGRARSDVAPARKTRAAATASGLGAEIGLLHLAHQHA